MKERSEGTKALFSSQLVKLEIPKYSGDNPTVWFSRVEQFLSIKAPQKHISCH